MTDPHLIVVGTVIEVGNETDMSLFLIQTAREIAIAEVNNFMLVTLVVLLVLAVLTLPLILFGLISVNKKLGDIRATAYEMLALMRGQNSILGQLRDRAD